MTKALATINPATTAQRIIEALAGGLQKAAAIYREYVEGGGDVAELRRAAPVSADLWRTLDDVACGRIDVRVMCLPAKAGTAIRQLPVAMQRNILADGVELLAADGSSIRVPVNELTSDQAAQVFYREGVRTLSQQAAYVKANTVSEEIKPTPVPWEVRGGKLRVYQPTELTASDLHRILGQMG